MELEDVIGTLPGVQDVAVVGIPHEVDQYRPLALVVKKKDADINEEAIVQFVAGNFQTKSQQDCTPNFPFASLDNLSEHKQLYGGVKFVNSIPRTPNGKIKRPKLADLL